MLGAALVGLGNVAWRSCEQRDRAQRTRQAARQVERSLQHRLSALDATVGALARWVSEHGTVDGELLTSTSHTLLRSEPAWLRAMAVTSGSPASPEVLAWASREGIWRQRLEEPDVTPLLRRVGDQGNTELVGLSDGRLALARAVSTGGGHAVTIGFVDAHALLSVPSHASYVVRGGDGEVVFRRGDVDPSVDVAAHRRTIRPGTEAWRADVFRVPAAEPMRRWLASGVALALVLALAAWLLRQQHNRWHAQGSARLYRTLFEEASDLVLLLDEELRPLRANATTWRLLELVEEADYKRSIIERFHPPDREYVEERLAATRNGDHCDFEARLANAPDRIYRFHSVPLRMDEAIHGTQLLGADITHEVVLRQDLREERRKLKAKNQQLYEASITDGLTGVLNRRYLTEQAGKEAERAVRYGRDLGCLFLDIDHFKEVNDRYGHAAGDEVLRTFAEVLSRNLRDSDTLGRYGGEEFVALLPEASPDAVLATAQKLIGLIRDTTFPALPEGTRVTVSIGAAALAPGGPRDAASLLEAADEAAYRAKEGGRDRIEAHDTLAPGEGVWQHRPA